MRRHEAFAKSIAKTHFDAFQDPAMRGTNFTWENFPEMVGRIAHTELFMYYQRQPKNFEELREQTRQLARGHAKAMVDAQKSAPAA